MTAITYRESLAGFVDFGADDWNEGWIAGREVGSGCAIHLAVAIDDIDTFVKRPRARRDVHGLGAAATASAGASRSSAGWFNLLTDAGGPRHRHMDYRLHARDAAGRPVTFVGFKDVHDDVFHDPWADTSTLFSRLYAGHLEPRRGSGRRPPRDGNPAHRPRRLRQAARVDPRARRRAARAPRREGALGRAVHRRADPRVRRAVARTASPTSPRRARGPSRSRASRPARGTRCPSGRGSSGGSCRCARGDGRLLTLHHVRRAGGGSEPERGPVLLGHGTGVRANLFYTPPLRTTLVDALLDAGHDVWLESWRGSIDLDTCEYTLDQVAVHDHPALVEAVLEETGAETLQAVDALPGLDEHDDGRARGAAAARAARRLERGLAARRPRAGVEAAPAGARPGCSSRRCRAWTRSGRSARPACARARFARTAELVRRECDNHVCAVANFTYGPGPDVLWRHENLTRRDAPVDQPRVRLGADDVLRADGQVRGGRPPRRGRRHRRGLPDDFAAAPPRTDARFTLLAGAENRCFLPSGQRRTHAWLEARRPGASELHVLPGYTHMDVFFGRDAARDVFPKIVAALGS